MKFLVGAFKLLGGVCLVVLAGFPLFALPATLSLGFQRRPGLEPQTLQEAADRLKETGLEGWPLVEAARRLVSRRMVYCRRNGYDLYPKAFERGYGYCQQMSFALKEILDRLGFEAQVWTALRNRFQDGSVSGHAWVRVVHGAESRHIDPLLWDEETQQPDFIPLTRPGRMSGKMRLIGGWGAPVVNAVRYYRTGMDRDF